MPDNQTTKIYPVYAVITHATGGRDEKWAQWIQRRLQNYRIPTDYIAQLKMGNIESNSDFVPTQFNVSTSPKENDSETTISLDGSASEYAKYLIVICSPEGARSEKVNSDVKNFVENGKEDYIVPFIIDGEPIGDDTVRAYPPSLSTDILGITLKDGNKHEALIKLISRMLRVKFSRLYQRHLRESRKFRYRILTVTMIVFALVLCLTCLAMWWQIEASKQRDEATSLLNFLKENIADDPSLPPELRDAIDERINEL